MKRPRQRQMFKRVREQEAMHVIRMFNDSRPLVVKVLSDGRMGVVSNDCSNMLWMEREFKPTVGVSVHQAAPTVELWDIPEGYGEFKNKSIGGVSNTVRRMGDGMIRLKRDAEGPIVLFASSTFYFDPEEVFMDYTFVDCGAPEQVDGLWVFCVTVVAASDVDHVCARLSRHGVSTMLEDESLRNDQPIGIERLDRIDSSVTHTDDEDNRWKYSEFGLGRGDENWKFEWIPNHWDPPTTWDHMVRNVRNVDILHLPFPLRQHVARTRLSDLEFANKDTRCHKATSIEACMCERCVLERQTNQLKKNTRKVSAALSELQSKQLIQAFFLLIVERVDDELQKRAAALILYRYLVEMGYLARWIGTYKQKAKFVGNGHKTRTFNRLKQYDPSRIPSKVLSSLLTQKGILQGKGSKGSRSKYVAKDERYVPKQRMRKHRNDEEKARMKE